MRRLHHFGIAIATMTLLGCVTSKRGKVMQKDIFALQKRIIELEQGLSQQDKVLKSDEKTATKVLASTNTELDRINLNLNKIRGEIDTLRIGVMTGQMPGVDAERGESIAAAISSLATRMEDLEANQAEILIALEKIEGKAKKKKKRSANKSLAALQKAFDNRRYRHVYEDAPTLIRKLKGTEKEQATFLMAESQYKLGKLRDAALKYNDFIERYPKSPKMAQAKMRMGDCFRHLGDIETAKVYYNELIKKFPDTEEATKARERVAEIEKKSSKKTGSSLRFTWDAGRHA